MERLFDVVGTRLRIVCAPCRRSGSYAVARLIAEHGAECALEVLRVRLAGNCRWRRAPGMRQPGKYEPKCQSRLTLPGMKPTGAGSFESFSGAHNVFRIDVWNSDDTGIAVEVLLCTNLGLARKWFYDVVALYPNELVTLRQKAQVLLSNERRLKHGTGQW